MRLDGLKKDYKPRNINVLFSHWIIMARQYISPDIIVKDVM
jgi:hypothetical protein